MRHDKTLTCDTCTYWEPHLVCPDNGRCRRHAPPSEPTVTPKYYWCGQHSAYALTLTALAHTLHTLLCALTPNPPPQ